MIYDDYESYVKKYRQEYGDQTLVLLECGSFYEIYDDGSGLTNMREVSDLLNIQVARRNKSVLEVSRNNFEMAGFPSHALKKFIQMLVQNNYTVVIVSQVTPPPNPQRRVTEIISPGTYIEQTSYLSNHLMVVYFEENEQYKSNDFSLSIGVSFLDVTTGKSSILEITSNTSDIWYPLDEIYRLMAIYSPKEVYAFSRTFKHLDSKTIIDYLELERYCLHNYMENVDPQICKPSYQNEVLQRTFPDTGMLTPVEFLCLERKPYALISFVKLLQFAHMHNEHLLDNICAPDYIQESKTLHLSYNCARQLDIHNNNQIKTGSLLNLLNNCKTAVGKRYFKYRLLNPKVNVAEMTKDHNLVEIAISKKIYDSIRSHLSNVYDIQRLFRRMAMNILHPHELFYLITSLKSLIEAIRIFHAIEGSDDAEKNIQTIIENLCMGIEVENLLRYNNDNMDGHIFVGEFDVSLSEVMSQLNTLEGKIHHLLQNMNLRHDIFKLEFNDKDGYYLSTTSKRFQDFKKESSEIVLENEDTIININDMICKSYTSYVRVTHPYIEKLNSKILRTNQEMTIITKNLYSTYLSDTYHKICNYITASIQALQQIDFITTNAFNANHFRLSRPIVQEDTKSFLKMKGLRHLLIEQLHPDIQYVTNDVMLGSENQDGMLLYGINSAGKSSFMKSVGLAITMIQSGMFAPCQEATISPYSKLFTRIHSNDDIFKGQSTFTKEILELRNILRRVDDHSLVIGDELCSGTESVSAISIVSAGIITLASKKTSFVFATHLHDLIKIPEVTDLQNVKVYHLSVSYDESLKKLVYDRQLKPGNGSTIYGIEVCKSLQLDREFLELANKIRCSYQNITPNIVDPESKSKYNSSLYRQKCNICSRPASEVHHIQQQKDADDEGYIGSYHKNSLFNLVNLCDSCHDKVHNGTIEIEKYVETNEGRVLKHRHVSQEDKTSDVLAYFMQNRKTMTKTKIIDSLSNSTGLSKYKIQKIIKTSS